MRKLRISLLPEKTGPLQTESYTSARKAEFLLNNAVDAKDYAQAVKEVRKLGLSERNIKHLRPA